ncbi:thiamine pyrophosphate-dependent enzyme [Myxococcus sp. K38C18041901]|uniref:thiamine pyrophosphate-dependent enzyme n=1 Tax=Myxococcus guangdongensis TaxID=2906760 RepID=UPI0020A79C31|nr:thiamine pyrophosphate-dependent enzyme [Myxococcus guangdongensis]MCP3060358.1 thiamine pyrophosphate-dependent enzyme [Myxococcus guangdongensis]
MKRLSGYDVLLSALRAWGVKLCTGVTGGGLLHFLQNLEPHPGQREAPSAEESPRFFTLGEYAAGFVPLGSYLATGELGCCLATTGAATKLVACALSDAKVHDLPAVFVVPLSSAKTQGLSPLQDTSVLGSNIVPQLQAELPGGVFVLDQPTHVLSQLRQAQHRLEQSKPIVLVIEPTLLKLSTGEETCAFSPLRPPEPKPEQLRTFVKTFHAAAKGRRIVILAGEELARVPLAPKLTTRLCEQLGASLVWSINGANGVERQNPWGHGYISFGGNDAAMEVWRSLGEDDVLLVLGACPDEYTVNLQPYPAGKTFVLTSIEEGYGQVDGSFAHRARHEFHQWVTPLDSALHALVEHLEQHPTRTRRAIHAPANLNHTPRSPPRPGFVDMRQLFSRLDNLWAPGTLGFDDVCLSYKDRQYVTQRPHPNARFFSLYRSSAMGNVLGLCVGARLSSPDSHIVGFTGDGCFRLFSGCLSEARNLDLLLFVLDNASYGLVEQALPTILPGLPASRGHSQLTPLEFGDVARACGWVAFDLNPELTNLDAILSLHRARTGQSILVTIPADSEQVLGLNPRAGNL